MGSSFLPHFHEIPASQKLTPEWAMMAVNYLYHNTGNKSLLAGKNIEEIDGYASGDFSMDEFRQLFKSQKRAMELEMNPNYVDGNGNPGGKNIKRKNPLGIEFTPLALLPEKLNSAEAIVAKIPVEVSCTANDPLAIKKKESDLNFLKNKAKLEDMIQGVSDQMGLGAVDLGTTENSSVPFSDSPFGLDLNNPDELEIFVNLLYSLKIESAFEVGLQAFHEITKALQVRRMEIRDQLRYGVSTRRAYQNPFTGLPDLDYLYPGTMEVPDSYLPDFSDNTHRVLTDTVTPIQLMANFPDEIKDIEALDTMLNVGKSSYCACTGRNSTIHRSEFNSIKLTLKYFEVISVDCLGIAKSKHKKGYTTLTESEDNVQDKVCAQNTYTFWWLAGTEHIFGIERLGFSYRTKGKESIQNFTTQIYKSNDKSAVELSVGENKKAQIADIKMQHAIIKSLPAGRYVDLRFVRNAITGLKGVNGIGTIDDLVRLIFEENIIIADTQGFEGKNDGQFKPVIDLPGGVKSEVVGYINIILGANQAISRITGINEQLTGQSANPEGLVGMQKLLINSSINALRYATDAMAEQDQKTFTTWANIIKQCIEDGGKPKEAIVRLIGSRKASVIDGLNDTRLHDIGVKVKVGQREEERQMADNQMARLIAKGVLSAADEFMAMGISNPKDKYAFLATKEQKWKIVQEQIAERNFQQQQDMETQRGENMVAVKGAEAEGAARLAMVKGEVQQAVIKLAAELGLRSQQIEAISDTTLNRERNRSQQDKNIAVLQEKSNLEQRRSLL